MKLKLIVLFISVINISFAQNISNCLKLKILKYKDSIGLDERDSRVDFAIINLCSETIVLDDNNPWNPRCNFLWIKIKMI